MDNKTPQGILLFIPPMIYNDSESCKEHICRADVVPTVIALEGYHKAKLYQLGIPLGIICLKQSGLYVASLPKL